MRPRVAFARGLLKLGHLIQASAIAVMRPADLVAFGRATYAAPQGVDKSCRDDVVDVGLFPSEKALLDEIPFRRGALLVLGVGGGREAIPLARMGFDVTGLDFVADMARRAQENAARRDLHLKILVQDMAALDLCETSYHVIWMSPSMYSCIPGRKRRIEALKRIQRALVPGGCFVCQFQADPQMRSSTVQEWAKKLIAACSLGHLKYQFGDVLWGNAEFIHAFSCPEELIGEFEEAGFECTYFRFPEQGVRGEAVLRKGGVENDRKVP